MQRNDPLALPLTVVAPPADAAGRVHSTSTCVHPSRTALATGTGSKTAASTQRSPRTILGGPATFRPRKGREFKAREGGSAEDQGEARHWHGQLGGGI